MYNTLVLRVRGDGRSYSLILRTDSFYDFTWHDAYYYVLYTRGGPHWQLTKVNGILINPSADTSL